MENCIKGSKIVNVYFGLEDYKLIRQSDSDDFKHKIDSYMIRYFMIFFIIVVLHPIQFSLFAQLLELEKTYKIEGKADIGDNFFVNVDSVSGCYDFTFFIKSRSDILSIENYKFDKDFNFLNSSIDELDIEKAKEKYPWWNYSGEGFETEAIYVDESDNLMLRRKITENNYDWKHLSYTQKSTTKEKSKLSTEKESSLYHYRNWWSADDAIVVYILCSENMGSGLGAKGFRVPPNIPHLPGPKFPGGPGGMNSDNASANKIFKMIKVGQDLKINKEVEIKFEYPQEIVFPRYLDKKTDNKENLFEDYLVMVFAPRNSGKKNSDPDKNNFTFVKINKELEIVDRISFNSPSTFWSIEDYLNDNQTGAVYLFGASMKTKDKYFNDLKNTKKFDGFEVLKIENHKVVFVSEFSTAELEHEIVTSPSKKLSGKYEGKKFFLANYALTNDGKLIFVGQNYFYSKISALSEGRKEVKYSDCFGIGISGDGKLLGQYLYDVKGFLGGQSFSIFQFLIPGRNPEHMYWLFMQPNYWNWSTFLGSSYYTKRPVKPGSLYLGSDLSKLNCDFPSSFLGKIDLSEKSMTEFTNYQIDKENNKFYYLCPNLPFMMTNDNKLIFFGTQSISGGKKLWFCRLMLD